MGEWEAEAYRFTVKRGRGLYRHLSVYSPSKRKVEMTESPTGRTLHIHVDGKRYVPEGEA